MSLKDKFEAIQQKQAAALELVDKMISDLEGVGQMAGITGGEDNLIEGLTNYLAFSAAMIEAGYVRIDNSFVHKRTGYEVAGNVAIAFWLASGDGARVARQTPPPF